MSDSAIRLNDEQMREYPEQRRSQQHSAESHRASTDY